MKLLNTFMGRLRMLPYAACFLAIFVAGPGALSLQLGTASGAVAAAMPAPVGTELPMDEIVAQRGGWNPAGLSDNWRKTLGWTGIVTGVWGVVMSGIWTNSVLTAIDAGTLSLGLVGLPLAAIGLSVLVFIMAIETLNHRDPGTEPDPAETTPKNEAAPPSDTLNVTVETKTEITR